jgi:hypothetical protein
MVQITWQHCCVLATSYMLSYHNIYTQSSVTHISIKACLHFISQDEMTNAKEQPISCVQLRKQLQKYMQHCKQLMVIKH